MTAHLASTLLNALVDGELSAEQAAAVKLHLDECPSCTASALNLALLKNAAARAGQRYTVPAQLEQRLRSLASSHKLQAPRAAAGASSTLFRSLSAAVAIAAMLLVVATGWIFTQRH